MEAFPIGALVYYLQKWFKTFAWYQELVRALPLADKWIHRIIAGLASLAAVLGVTFTITGSANAGWHFSGSIPDVHTMLVASWAWAKVFASQQWMYETTRKPEPSTITVAAVAPVAVGVVP